MRIEHLLEQDFVAFYKLQSPNKITVITKNDISFCHNDLNGDGCANYSNPMGKDIYIIDYESFFKSLNKAFIHSKPNCDTIVYTKDNTHFTLNELTNTQSQYIDDFIQPKTGEPREGKLKKAIKQLEQTLELIYKVPNIDNHINAYNVKRCCFFSRQPYSASDEIDYTLSTFNKMNSIYSGGIILNRGNFSEYNFEFIIFSDNQEYIFN